jgi:hypothetical protein
MKRAILWQARLMRLLVLAGGVMVSAPASAATYTLTGFEGADAGGVGSASVTLDVVGNQFKWTMDNTSPTTLISGTGNNSPAITGFGFNLEDPIPGLSSWSLTAFDADGNLTQIGGGGALGPGTGHWEMGTFQSGVRLDFLPQTAGAPPLDGAIYNPDASPPGNHTNFFTTATLVMNFDAPPILVDPLDGNAKNFYVRMQRVGRNTNGSLKLFADGSSEVEEPDPQAEVPEPTSMALFGIGLACCSGWATRRRRQPGQPSQG